MDENSTENVMARMQVAELVEKESNGRPMRSKGNKGKPGVSDGLAHPYFTCNSA